MQRCPQYSDKWLACVLGKLLARNLRDPQRAAEVGAVSPGTVPLLTPTEGLPLLTLTVAEGPVLFTVWGRLRNRAGDGMAEHLLLGRLQHRSETAGSE